MAHMEPEVYIIKWLSSTLPSAKYSTDYWYKEKVHENVL